MRAIAILALLGLACGERGPDRLVRAGGRADLKQGLVLCVRDDDTIRFVRRIDGTVAGFRRAAVTRDQSQYLVIATKEPGRDQGKIIVLDPDGSVAADYRVSGDSPFRVRPELARFEGETLRQLQAPLPDQIAPFRWDGRRLLALCTADNYAPASLVLLEATAPDRLEERLVFWNWGHIHYLLEDAPYLVIMGVGNAFLAEGEEGYPSFAAVFSVEDLPWSGAGRQPVRANSPTPQSPPTDRHVPYRYYMVFPLDGATAFFRNASVRAGRLRMTNSRGLTYGIDLATGQVEAAAGETYAEAHAERRRDDPSLPPLEEHVRRLSAAVRIWRR